ncbi:MAG: replicative DNA helicase [Candidatus Nanopelagicales bacterium]|nr:replicative DNA helicase [Candidatus Nanopelagicales bacterium]
MHPDEDVAVDRTPPSDNAAEQSVLGAMLLSKDAIADVVEVLRENDFYRPAHQAIYSAILDLYGRGEPADAVTVAADLTRTGEIGRVGGAPYLHTLVSMVPTAANAGYYGRIVREKAILRRLVEAGTRIVAMGYAGQGDVDQTVDRAQAEVYDVTDRRTSEDYAPLSDIMGDALNEIEAISNRNGEMIGVPTGFTELDKLTNGLHPGQLIIVAARPAIGKSTLGVDIARAASIKHGLSSVIFSLEMSRSEIVMRLLSAEAQVPLHHMRAGTMSDGDWTKLANKMGVVSEAPLFIDDSPNMTLMEIRAKCRRLKQRHDLRLVIVDYLQLMTSGKRVESRQQEVSEFSRSLKLLAKELSVPVIAISQLNRGPEQRTDKKPMLSDLRESGCLPASSRIVRADTGAEVTIGELMTSAAKDVPVWALDDSLRYVTSTMTHAFPTGRKEVFKVRTASGRVLRATANHPLLTYRGWKPLGEMAVGSRIAIPRHVPAPSLETTWTDDHVIVLAHMIGDGSMLARQPIRYATKDPANQAVMTEATPRAFAIRVSTDNYEAARCTTVRFTSLRPVTHGVRNPLAKWLDELGLFNKRSHEKFIPEPVFSLPKAQIALFLRHLWATDGSIQINAARRGGRIYYASTSRRLADDVARLLLRFGLTARIHVARKSGYRDGYHVDVSGAADQKVFLRRIGAHGQRGLIGTELLAILETISPNTNRDTVPREVWDDVREILADKGMTHREFAQQMGTQFCGSTMWKRSPSRERLSKVAEVLDDSALEMVATNDVYWDEIVSIESVGEEDVYDATVLARHNFIADGVVVHNSLEQDADMVVLLHREDAYEKESPRAGEADFIVAKHRNGPTATVTVAFQGHYSRFVDMAQI